MPPVLKQGCSQCEKPRGSEALPQHVHLHLWAVWYDFWQKDCTVQPPEEHAQKARNDECIYCFSLEINILQPGTSNFSILKVAWASSRRSISKPCQTTPFFVFFVKNKYRARIMPGGMWSWSILILRRDRALFVKFVTSLSKIISISMIIRGAFMAFIKAILISSAKQFLMMLHILILRRNTVPRWLRHVCEKRCQFWVPRLYNLSRVHK